MGHIRPIAVLWAIVLAILVAGDAVIYAIRWGYYGHPNLHFHWLWLPLAGFVLAALIYVVEQVVARYPELGWLARLHIPRWSHLEPFFKNSKIIIHIVALSYALFYVTQGVNKGSKWALWVNANIFHFELFCHTFTATEVMRIEITGYVLYLALQAIYSIRCPQILAHSMRKKGGLPRDDASLVFVETIERHGGNIPPSNLADTMANFAAESNGSLDTEIRTLMNARVTQLRAVGGAAAPVVQAVVGHAAGVARLLPTSLAMRIYYLSKDLFDILYPATRGILCVGVAVAVITTSLPVVAKLVWVMLPRLGETCMADIVQPPPGFRDSEWVEFEGKLDSATQTEVVLIPGDDDSKRWHLAPADVTDIGTKDGARQYFLRRGGTVREITTVSGRTPAPPAPPGMQTRMSVQCGAAGSQCSNFVELCCGSGLIVGRCFGSWSCPVP